MQKRPRTSDRPRRRPVRLAAAALLVCGTLALSGCDATTIDVYVETSQTETDAAGEVLETTSYELDEKGNQVGGTTTVEDPSVEEPASLGSAWTTAYDAFGVPVPPEGSYETELDDHGQPTRIVYYGPDGEVVSTRTFTYSNVAGHMTSETYEADGFSCSTTYDSKDGWPLTGSVTVDGTTVDIEFVYEITDQGGVTAQHVVVDGTDVASYTYSYEEYDGTLNVAQRGNPDGTTTGYTYELVENPSPFAMARALVHEVDYEALLPYLGLSAQ